MAPQTETPPLGVGGCALCPVVKDGPGKFSVEKSFVHMIPAIAPGWLRTLSADGEGLDVTWVPHKSCTKQTHAPKRVRHPHSSSLGNFDSIDVQLRGRGRLPCGRPRRRVVIAKAVTSPRAPSRFWGSGCPVRVDVQAAASDPPLAVRSALAILAGVGSGRPIGRDSAAWSGKANGWAARALELPRPLPFQTSHSRHPRFPLRMARQGEKQKLRIGQGGEMLAGFLQEGPISASALPRALLL